MDDSEKSGNIRKDLLFCVKNEKYFAAYVNICVCVCAELAWTSVTLLFFRYGKKSLHTPFKPSIYIQRSKLDTLLLFMFLAYKHKK